MGQSNYDVYMLDGTPNTFVYTTTKCKNVLTLLETLGFKYQYTAYTYGWSIKSGHMYSVPQYFGMEDKNRMIKLVRIANGTDKQIKRLYEEVCETQPKIRKRWWEYYDVK